MDDAVSTGAAGAAGDASEPGQRAWVASAALRQLLTETLDRDAGKYLRELAATGMSPGAMRARVLEDTGERITGRHLGLLLTGEAWANGEILTPRKAARARAVEREQRAAAAGAQSPGRAAWDLTASVRQAGEQALGARAFDEALAVKIADEVPAVEVAAWLLTATEGRVEVTADTAELLLEATAWAAAVRAGRVVDPGAAPPPARIRAGRGKTQATKTRARRVPKHAPLPAQGIGASPASVTAPPATEPSKKSRRASREAAAEARQALKAKRAAEQKAKAAELARRRRAKEARSQDPRVLAAVCVAAEAHLGEPLPGWLLRQSRAGRSAEVVHADLMRRTRRRVNTSPEQLEWIAHPPDRVAFRHALRVARAADDRQQRGVVDLDASGGRDPLSSRFWSGIATQRYVRGVGGGLPSLGKRR